MNRQEYLQEIWSPYPSAPAEILYSGRIVLVQRKGEALFFRIERQEQISEFSVSDTALESVLQPGDLIAVDSSEKVHLLAPGSPSPSPIPLKNLQLWQKFLQEVRRFFSDNEFLEIQTPTLVVCPGTEPTLDIFSTQLQQGSIQKTLFLPTSPELHLKKSLCLGFDKVFELKNCFRNNEFSEYHQPEFIMLEWYRAYQDLQAIELDIKDLLRFLIAQFPNENIFTPQSYRVATVAELFQEFAKAVITPFSNLEDYKKIALDNQLSLRGVESIDDYFFAIFINKIEPQIPRDQFLVVKDYPPFQAALARLTSTGWADRMEVYFGGLELANGFNELNDPEEQARRFEKDLAQKKALGKLEIPIDQEFMDLLKKGMPPSAGIALGLERLFMTLFGIKNIKDTKLFPYL